MNFSSLLSSLRVGKRPNKQGSDKWVYVSCPPSSLTGCSVLCPLLLFLLPVWWYFLPLDFSLPGCLYFPLSFPLVLIPHVISTVVSVLMPSASQPHVWAPGHYSWQSLTMAIWLAGPSPPQTNMSETELSLLRAKVPVSYQTHRGTHVGLFPPSPTCSLNCLQSLIANKVYSWKSTQTASVSPPPKYPIYCATTLII